jgi:carbonic anhydrase
VACNEPSNDKSVAVSVEEPAKADIDQSRDVNEHVASEEESHSAEAGHDIHWDYGSEEGPAQWGSLSPDYATCNTGREQSPIDITGAISGSGLLEIRRDLKPVNVVISHQESTADLLDNGHTIQVNVDEGSELEVEGATFRLVQYHFHAPSEHTLNGRHFPMEIHFVHTTDTGALAVGGFFIEEGAHNDAMSPVWKNLPQNPGESLRLDDQEVDLDNLIPADGAPYFHYKGSLTTPPCSENVHWFVREKPLEMSADQIAIFTALFINNNRPVQPLNDREITYQSATYID